MNNLNDHFVQYLAYVLVLTGLVACGLGDLYHLSTLANGGTTALGLGGGILTGQKLQQMTQKGGGNIVNPSPQGND